MKRDYLIREQPVKALLVFAFPMMIGNLFQQFYTMADSVVVGRFVGQNALAAVGASYSLTNVFISIAIGGGVGASVITGQYFGAKNYARMKQSVRTALTAFAILSLALGAVGLLFSREILIWLKTPGDILGQATEYLRIYFLGLPFLFMYNIFSAMFQALGRSKIPLYLLIFSSVFNIGLDVFFVCAAGMGIAGAAWATLIAQGLSAVLAAFIFAGEMREYPDGGEIRKTGAVALNLRKRRNDLCGSPLRCWFDKNAFFLMAKVALPSILQQSTVSVGMMLVQSVVNSFGAEALAGYSAGMRIESFCIVPMAAMGNAISAYTAQNIGAQQTERVRKGYRSAYWIVAVAAVCLCVWIEGNDTPLILLFLGESGTEKAIATGSAYLRFIGWFFALIGLKMITDGVLRGSGDMKMFTVANLVNLGIRVAIAATLAPVYGISMVWTAVPVGWLANYAISYAQYRTGKWRTASAAVKKS